MCGISGCLRRNDNLDSNVLRAMNEALAHRGPDGEGIWVEGNVGLAHRRLSIIDLSDAAAQPMHSEDGRFHIVFNGEIYNYRDLARELNTSGTRLRTHSDTEVILHLFARSGIDALQKLRGMFAFALWDSHTKELLLVRDRLGIKPLYYLTDDSGLIFASEIKAIAVVHPKLSFDRSTFWKFLRVGTSQGTDTVFSEVKRVEPGCYLRVKEGSVESVRYWSLESVFRQPIREYTSEELAVEEFTSELEEAVRYHLVADVPVGGFLSGGLDSSTVMGFMRRVEPAATINTYSIVFQEDAGAFDESYYSSLVSEHLKTNHTKAEFTPAFLEEIDEIAWHCDEPFGIASSYALFTLSREAAKGVKVVLSGDGGDELLAGYQGYLRSPSGYPRPTRIALDVTGNLFRKLATALPVLQDEMTTTWLKLLRKGGSQGLTFSELEAYCGALYYNVFNREYVSEAWQTWTKNNGARYYDALAGNTELRRMLYSATRGRLVDEMLTKVDRMTMASSLEARVPLLDHKLVEFCIRLNDGMKLNRSRDGLASGKYILKRAAERVIPKEAVHREKHGFDIPMGKWLSTVKGRTFIGDTLLNGVLVREGILKKERLTRLLNAEGDALSIHGQFLTNLIAFEQWHNAYDSRIEGFRLAF